MTTKSSLLRLSIGSDLEQVDLVGVVVQSALEQIAVDPERGHWLVMSVREAVINAILHGNQQEPDKRVLVEGYADPSGVMARPSRASPSRSTSTMRPTGWGSIPRTSG